MANKGFKLKAKVCGVEQKTGRIFIWPTKKARITNLAFAIADQYKNLPEGKELQITIKIKDKK